MATEVVRESRKRTISAGSPPPAEDEEVIGPMPVAPEAAAKKKKKGEGVRIVFTTIMCTHDNILAVRQ